MFYSKLPGRRDIFLNLKANDKMDLIYQVIKLSKVKNKKQIFEAISEREKLGTTGIGGGVALPHARTKLVKGIISKFILLKDGIDFEALDGKKVNFIFLVLAPYTCSQEYLETLSKIAKLMKREEVKRALLKVTTKKEIVEILRKG